MGGESLLTCCFDDQGNLDNNEFNHLAEQLHSMIMKYIRRYYLPGGDRDDLYQWGLMGLYKAVLQFDENGQYSFDFVASRNIKNMIKTAITTANRKKHRLITDAESLHAQKYKSVQDRCVELIDRLVLNTRTQDPLEVVADKESVENIHDFINRCLSDIERNVILLYMRGYRQQDIARKLNIGKKAVDNAMQRAKKKIFDYITRADGIDLLA